MNQMDHSQQSYKPLLLQRSLSYPAYQLRVMAGGQGTSPGAVLKICILETMQWLRQRFRAFELPEELDLPDASRYNEVAVEQFRSFHLDLGYRLDVVWLPANGIWTLQLTEPDVGTRPEDPAHSRPPAVGRLIETNISYNLLETGVLCGFKTMISQPDTMPQDCEVFRYGFIKYLARNKLVGLTQYWKLTDTPQCLDDPSRFRHFQRGLQSEDRTMPVVVMAEMTPVQSAKKSTSDLMGHQPNPSGPLMGHKPKPGTSQMRPDTNPADSLRRPSPNSYDSPSRPSPVAEMQNVGRHMLVNPHDFSYLRTEVEPPPPPVSMVPESLAILSRYHMGYAHFFHVPSAHLQAFVAQTGLPLTPGGMVFCEPPVTGGAATPHSAEQLISSTFVERMNTHIQNYLRGKDLPFPGCTFLEEARSIEFEQLVRDVSTREELIHHFERKLRETEETARRRNAEVYSDLTRKADKMAEKAELLEEENRVLRQEIEAVQSAAAADGCMQESDARRMRMLRNRPVKPAGIPMWVAEWFPHSLLFHDKAIRMIRSIPSHEVDLPLLLDALEYLGTEYWETLQGMRTEQERDDACSRQYDRPFTVTTLRGISTVAYSQDYHISYGHDARGKPMDVLLGLHLKVGNDPQNLLRIYFLYDKESKKIVIGALPKHLPTMGYA